MRQKQLRYSRRLNNALPAAKDEMAGGIAAHQAGNLQAAEAFYRRVLEQDGAHPAALHYLGLALYQRGQVAEAAALLRKSIDREEGNAFFRSNFGLILLALGEVDQAIEECRAALRLVPDFADAHNNLANALLRKNALDEATQHYTRAVELRPNYIEARTNIGVTLVKRGKLREAIAHYRDVLSFGVRHAPLHYNLGNALTATDQYDEAIEQFKQALALDPQNIDASHNIGTALQASGRSQEAAHWYRKTLQLAPDYAKSHFHLAVLQLDAGDFEAGWNSYEWRFKAQAKLDMPHLIQSQWQGEPLNGRRILLHPEQGLGDTLQFLRYVPMVAKAGGRVVLQVQPSLRRLADEMARHIPMQVFNTSEALPDFDLQCPLLSLPLAFGTRMASIPALVPYLAPPAEELAQAKALSWPESGLRVGLVWAGNPEQLRDRFRSLALTTLAPVLEVEGVHFFSLQVGPEAAQLDGVEGTRIVNLEPDPGNMADAAAKMLQLDLVITVCTAPAHLAGALAIPTWVMLEYVADWRWFKGRTDSPWYPTTRLFRQPARGDWASVVANVASQLALLRDTAQPTDLFSELTHA